MAAVTMGAPQQEQMAGCSSKLDEIFGDKNGLLVKQTTRGCIQECLGCEARSEYKVSKMEWDMIEYGYRVVDGGMDKKDVLYALEESSCCIRYFWRDGRGFNMKISEGGEAGSGAPVLNYKAPCGFPVGCCCLLPNLAAELPNGSPLGASSHFICDQYLFVPKLSYRENGEDVYILRPETCCGGCCLACNCQGKGAIGVPFYFHEPTTMKVVGGEYGGETTPQIRKLWAGFKKECCSTADTFAVMFPPGINSTRKAGLLGLTFLLDFSVFERQNEGN